jgi:hypothetical protein
LTSLTRQKQEAEQQVDEFLMKPIDYDRTAKLKKTCFKNVPGPKYAKDGKLIQRRLIADEPTYNEGSQRKQQRIQDEKNGRSRKLIHMNTQFESDQ